MLQRDQGMINISVIYRRTAMWEEGYAISLGLTQAQIPVLAVICKHNGILQNTLRECLNMDKGTIAKSVAKLEQNGYVRKENMPEDKRAYFLVPTQKAKDIYPTIVEKGEVWFDHLTSQMSVEEKKQFERLLDIAARNSLKKVEDFNEHKNHQV